HSGFDGWITGRKRYHSGQRAAIPKFEADAAGRLKLNPLADWGPDEARAYLRRHDLPAHPLVARGYPSIGCAPCTSPVAPGEDPRAGRWRGEAKTECGIHFVDGKIVRGAA
ncbi:MAG: phosphoadenosine phosphosulfate reductase family protein, partial [Pseudomonadota bacterium]